MSDFPIKDIPVTDILERLRTKYCCTTENCNCEEAATEIETLRHDLERQMTIANEHVNEAERLRAEAQAQFDRGYYDGCANPIVRHDALRDALQHCADAIASWAKKPEGADPWLLGALDNALEALEQNK